jgi:hypothetical protein
MNERRLRLDFAIALCALLISSVAAFATVYQTHVIARQFSATVWPYVSFDEYNSPTQLQIIVRNDGLGPAIVRSAKLTWEGKPVASLEEVLTRFARENPKVTTASRAALRAGAHLRITLSTPTAGLVVPANGQHTLFAADGAVLVQYFRPELKRLGISLCYCSLTGSCWVQTIHNRAGEPTVMSSCPKSA